jgi:hypothetical protein
MPGTPPASGSSRAPREPRVAPWRTGLRWGAVPLLIGGGLLAALLLHALLGGAREAALRAAVLVGAGDLTLQPEGARSAPGERVIEESGAVFTNPALMKMPARIALRVELRVEAATPDGKRRQAADLIGIEGPGDPQAVLLAKFLAAGSWPAAEPESAGAPHAIVLGQDFAERLALKLGDEVRVRAGAPGMQRAWRGRVAGIVRTGLAPLDGTRLWTSAAAARDLLNLPPGAREEAASRLAVYLDRPGDAADWLDRVRRLTLPEGVEVLTWRQVDPDALPWVLWLPLQRRVEVAVYTLLAGTAALGALFAAWPRRSAARRSLSLALGWELAGPLLLGLALGLLSYTVLAWLGRAHPLPATDVFAALGPGLNPYGALTGPVTPGLALTRALRLCLASAGWYAVLAALLYWRAERARPGTPAA